jgi:hypothetical protein
MTVVSEPQQTTAADLLTAIVLAAARDRAANLDVIVSLAIKCAATKHAQDVEAKDPNHEKHGQLIREARHHADQRRWSVVARLLRHG